MEVSSGPRSDVVDPSCACSEMSMEIPAPELPSGANSRLSNRVKPKVKWLMELPLTHAS